MTLRPRGRPRSFDPGAVLHAAAERFRAGGYAGTSLDDLAAATGLNRPSLYAAFGDKEALYLAALDGAIARAERAFDRLIASRPTARAGLQALFGYVVERYLAGEDSAGGCLVVSTAATAAVDHPAIRERVARIVALEDDRIAELLAAAGDANAPAHARLVSAAIHSLSVRARAGATRAELEQVARDCIDVVAPPPAPAPAPPAR